jgi:hypothetical protein
MDGEKDMANPHLLANTKETKGNARGTNRAKAKAKTTRQKAKGKAKEKYAPKRPEIVSLNRVATARNLVMKAANAVNGYMTKNKKPKPPIPTTLNTALTFTLTKPF